MDIGIKVEPLYRIRIKGTELTLTSDELLEFRDTINQLLSPKDTEDESLTDDDFWALQNTLDVPDSVPRDLNPFAMAMLAVCIKYHKGHENRAYASDIVDEIVEDYPDIARHYKSKGRMSYATIFTAKNKGKGLVPKGLLNMDYDEDGSRVYWTE